MGEPVIVNGKPVTYHEKEMAYDPNTTLRRIEEIWMSKALIHHDGNIVATARALGISRKKLYRAIERWRSDEG